VTDDAAQPSPAGGAGAGPLPAPVVDPGARDWTRTRTSDATTPPPAPATAVVEAVREDHDTAPPTPAPAARPPLPVQGLLAALVAGVLALASTGGRVPLLAAVLVLQVVLAAALLALLDAPAARGSLVVVTAAALAADAVAVVDDGAVDRLAGVVGLGLVVALLHQLVRRGRNRVTESLADTLLGVVAVTSAACLAALLVVDGGEDVLHLALAVAAAVLLAGRLGDAVLPRPVLAAGGTRGWPGFGLGALAGVGVALLLADRVPLLPSLQAAVLVALVVAVVVATADLAVDLGASELRAGRRDARRVAALRPAAALLPFAVLAPVALLAGRLVLP
jgi:hypothetical protein